MIPFGPHEVIQKVGIVAYNLELSPSAKIHPVFHVSQLKGAVGSSHIPTALPQKLNTDLELEVEPEAMRGVKHVACEL